jgi:cytochrome c-type biogenesis protein CcmH
MPRQKSGSLQVFLTLLGSVLIVSSIAMLVLFVQRARNARRTELDLETCKACLEDIGALLKLGKLSEAEADAARLALLSEMGSSGRGSGLKSIPQPWIAAAAVFLLVSGIGAVGSRVGDPSGATGSGISSSGADGETVARLKEYARSIGSEQPASMAATGELLPDVNTMIERLAARLETTPQDIEGWRMLGWSYFHTAQYEQAATALGRALELDPGSAELRLSYEEAKAKAAESDDSETASSGGRR